MGGGAAAHGARKLCADKSPCSSFRRSLSRSFINLSTIDRRVSNIRERALRGSTRAPWPSLPSSPHPSCDARQ